MFLSELLKNNLYIVSISGVPNGAIFTKIITIFTKYKTKLINNYNKPIVTHTALLVNHNNDWYIHEVDFGGQISKLFIFNLTRKYYISNIGKITQKEKLFIMNQYSDKQRGNFLQLSMKYPLLKAIASYELPKINLLFNIINKTINYIRDIYESTLKFIGIKERMYCVESALETIRDINHLRVSFIKKQNYILLNLGTELLNKIKEQDYRLDELYPQDIIENLHYSELQSSL